jgi:RNA polymerase sigma-70 factor (ECF subfamily)
MAPARHNLHLVNPAPSLRSERARLPPLSNDDLSYVWSSLRRLGVPERDLEDVTQDVVVVFYQRVGDFDPGRPLKPWLFGIAARVAANHARLARHTREHLAGDSAPEPADDAPAAEAKLEAEETRQLVIRCLQTLELDRRTVFVMHDIDGIPIPEVAAVLSIPLNTAYSRLRLAREQFKATLQREKLRRGAP